MTLDEMKSNWNQDQHAGTYDQQSIAKVIKTRVRKHTGESFKYFWASLTLQILVYSLLSHVIVKNFGDTMITIPGILGILLFIPFTFVLMKKFKSMARTSPTEASMNIYVSRQHELLGSFYTFKKRYEMILVPLATLIGTFVTFELYVPGGIRAYPKGAMITFFISLASCILAIQAENKKSFEQPLSKLRAIMNDLNEN
ncbi:MAG TPA: hypothetical protein VK508_20575 [Cyclobacteriaceae bacterium]|nr:hypothetical protein [Cyclobacteriaceae bacterium]